AWVWDDRTVEVSDSLVHSRFSQLVFDWFEARQRRYTGFDRARGGRPVVPQRRPDLHQIAFGRQHHAFDGGLDQRTVRSPGQHFVDRDRDGGIEQQVGVERGGGGAVEGAAAAERLH